MYIDYRKFNYSQYGFSDKDERIENDKKYFQTNFLNWAKKNAEKIAERQWEIDDIGAIERSGEFIKLIKESEFSYSIGCYISTIALIGVASEDLSRFYSSLCGKNYEQETQYNRTNKLLQDGLISQNIHDLTHEIRIIRNGCLHFNEGFKQKDDTELKREALKSINNLKLIYKELIGQRVSNEFNFANSNSIIETLAKEMVSENPGGAMNIGDIKNRIRNIFSDFTGIDLSIGLKQRKIIKESLYEVLEIDLDIDPPEISLSDKTEGLPVIIDLTDDWVEEITLKNIREGDMLIASIISNVNELGMSESWSFVSIEKI